MLGRIASKKPSRPLSDQLITFEFAVKLLDDFGVEFRMKTGCHGTAIARHHRTFFRSGLPRQIGNELDYAATPRSAGTTVASFKATGRVSVGSGSMWSAMTAGEKPVSA